MMCRIVSLQLKMLQFAVTAPFCFMTAGEIQLKFSGVGIIVECDNPAVPTIGRSHPIILLLKTWGNRYEGADGSELIEALFTYYQENRDF